MKHVLCEGQPIQFSPYLGQRQTLGTLAGVSIATLLAVSAPAYAQESQAAYLPPTPTPENTSKLELECVPQGEKFLCEVADDAAIAPSLDNAKSSDKIAATTSLAASSDASRIRVSNLALAIAVFLFGSIAFKVMMHRKHEGADADQLEKQIELLERIWHKGTSV